MASLATKKGLDINELLSSTYIPVKISPISPDYDNDGIPNEFDPKSEEVFDNRFELVNKYNADPYDLFPDYVLHGKEKYGESSDDYYDLLYDKWYNSEYQIAKRANNTEKMSEIKKKYLGTEVFEHVLSFAGLLLGEVSGINLERYLDKTLEHNEVEKLSPRVADLAIGDSKGGRFGFYTCMNLFFQCAEDTVIQGCNNKALSSKTTYHTLLPGSSIWNVNSKSFIEDYIIKSPKTIEEWDILLGLSDYSNAIVSDNISCYEKKRKIYYSAKVRYYILDLYDYTGLKYLGVLNNVGLACPYLYSSCKEMDLTWEKGARFPSYSSYSEVELHNTSYPNIQGANITFSFGIPPAFVELRSN